MLSGKVPLSFFQKKTLLPIYTQKFPPRPTFYRNPPFWNYMGSPFTLPIDSKGSSFPLQVTLRPPSLPFAQKYSASLPAILPPKIYILVDSCSLRLFKLTFLDVGLLYCNAHDIFYTNLKRLVGSIFPSIPQLRCSPSPIFEGYSWTGLVFSLFHLHLFPFFPPLNGPPILLSCFFLTIPWGLGFNLSPPCNLYCLISLFLRNIPNLPPSPLSIFTLLLTL